MDSRGTLLKGALLSGAVFVVTAALVPFDSLNDIISAGALLAFNLVTSSLLVLRHRWVITTTAIGNYDVYGLYNAKTLIRFLVMWLKCSVAFKLEDGHAGWAIRRSHRAKFLISKPHVR